MGASFRSEVSVGRVFRGEGRRARSWRIGEVRGVAGGGVNEVVGGS